MVGKMEYINVLMLTLLSFNTMTTFVIGIQSLIFFNLISQPCNRLYLLHSLNHLIIRNMFVNVVGINYVVGFRLS